MPKNSRQYRYCLILTTALVIVTSSKADTPIENYSSGSLQLLAAKQEEGCKDDKGNLIPCPHYKQ